MTEATNRAGTEVGPMPGTTAPESYRPLSLLALAGFAIAVVYGLIVVVGAAVALVNRIPWLLPTWTFLGPIAALLLCWMARIRIRNAEGTLSGLAFTTWGFRLAVMVGLTYSFYYGFTYVAVYLQAKDCVEQFFAHLKQGRTDKAFLLTVGSAAPSADDDQLRGMIESMFNSPGPPARSGPYSQFRQSELVRLIQTGGADTRLTPLGVVAWSYEQGGYQLTIKYQVLTPLAEFETVVGAFGSDSKPNEPKGRQWKVVLRNAEALVENLKLTARGEELMSLSTTAWDFAQSWQNKINGQRWDEVYLDTLSPAERDRLRKGQQMARFLAAAPLAGLTSSGLRDAACHDFLSGRATLADGKLINADDKTFWTSSNKEQSKDIHQCIQQTFRPGAGPYAARFELQRTRMPLWRNADGHFVFLFDILLLYADETTAIPKYLVEGQLAVAAEEGQIDKPLPPWRIQAIELSSGRTAPKMPEGPPGRGPAGRPPG